MQTLYQILRVPADAHPSVLRKGFYALVREHHVSGNVLTGDEASYQSLCSAYEQLETEEGRRAYDESIRTPDSVLDLFVRHPAGRAVVDQMLPPSARGPRRGLDLLIIFNVREGDSSAQILPNLTVEIPPGWAEHPVVQFFGRGMRGEANGPPGDLFVWLRPRR